MRKLVIEKLEIRNVTQKIARVGQRQYGIIH